MIASLQESLQTLHGSTAGSESPLRRVSPVPKAVCCVVFLGMAVSFGRYDWRGTFLFALLPMGAAYFGRIPLRPLLKRCAAGLPFVLCAGLANCFFDRTPVTVLADIVYPGGVVALAVLFAKTLATIGMVLVLTASTSMSEIAAALTWLRVPCILVLQLQLLFRYLILVVGEAKNVTTAYMLRNPGCRTVPLRDWGALIGRLFLRTVERADAVYQAMQCRLFHAGHAAPMHSAAGTPREWAAGTIWIGILVLLRYCL